MCKGGLAVEYRDQRLQFEPCSCNSGEELGYFGVELWQEETGDVLVLDHVATDGPRLAFWPGGRDWDESFPVIPDDDCREFTGELKRTDDEIDKIAVMRGALELDCETAEGMRVRGRLEFDRCASLDARTNSLD